MIHRPITQGHGLNEDQGVVPFGTELQDYEDR